MQDLACPGRLSVARQSTDLPEKQAGELNCQSDCIYLIAKLYAGKYR